MIRDYKNLLKQEKTAKFTYWHGLLLFVISAALAVWFAQAQKSPVQTTDVREQTISPAPIITIQPAESENTPAETAQLLETFEIELPRQQTDADDKASDVDWPAQYEPENWQAYIVKPGYNFAIICSRAGIKASEVHALMQLGTPVAALKKLFPKDEIRLIKSPEGQLLALEYDPHPLERLVVRRTGENTAGQSQFTAEIVQRPLDTHTAHASGVIKDSLFLAARKAKLTDKLAIELASIFAWDIDFSLEVRKGDRFTVVYEQFYRSGEKINDGPIIAAEFVNKGKTYRAIRYTNPKGDTDYYAPNGNSLRKTFMRNPVDFSRISSRFNLKRKHPILNKIRAHKGVDYAAPTGTPIKAVGDGRISFRNTKGGYGRTIILQHGQRYSTLYAHMSKYAKKSQVGRKVKQGQIIGYIGRSGLATGPHLHYEFRIDGVHRNPLTVKHPSVAPIPDEYKTDFFEKIQTSLAQLDTINRLRLASDYSTSPNTF